MPALTNIRIFFSKTGRAIYISHLDLYRVFQRAVKRSKLPVWETQGFNPHVYITFALPLALGTHGLCESLDTRLTENLKFSEVKDRLNAALPRDIRVISVEDPVMKPTEIEKSEYEAEFVCDYVRFGEFINAPEILAEKRTKKGVSEIDIKKDLKILEYRDGFMRFTLPSGTEFNINANLIFDTFEKQSCTEFDTLIIKRTGIYCKNGEIFS